MSGRVIYIVRSWPRLSQTFIVNEVLALERRGVDLAIFSLVRSGEDVVQPQLADVRASVRYVAELAPRRSSRIRSHLALLVAVPRDYLGSLVRCLRRPGLAAGYGECSALGCFGQAVRVATAVRAMRQRGEAPVRVHAHFAHDPALVGMLAARLCGLPFSFTAHARDLVQIPPTSLARRATEATAVVTCCAVNAAYIRSAVPAADRPPVLVIRHGVDLERFAPAPEHRTPEVPTVISVGRLVPKKGYADLLRALQLLRRTGARFRFGLYGDGPLWDELVELRDELGLRGCLQLMGARDNDQIVSALRGADVFALTPRVAEDGDRDGIPNVLVEAMACALPVVTTSAGGVTELVEHGVNGLLADPGDVPRVAELIGTLLSDPEQRRRLGAAARRTVERSFDVDSAARELERVLIPESTADLEEVR
jgi:glycosyltransferase involved in cell wall biosynthesis